jgi:hypothetical protein
MTTRSSASPNTTTEEGGLFSRRSRKQFSLFLAGSTFALLSAAITRRAVVRRIQWARPTFFHPNNQPSDKKMNGGLEALEALSVATVTAVSWTVMITGGFLWAIDVSSLQELRAKVRGRLGLTEEEQKESQATVGQIIDAAKPWKRQAQDVADLGREGSPGRKPSGGGTPPS